MRQAIYFMLFTTLLLCSPAARNVSAQSQSTYLQLSPTVKAVLYSPDRSIKARVAVVNMHEDGNRLARVLAMKPHPKLRRRRMIAPEPFSKIGWRRKKDDRHAITLRDHRPRRASSEGRPPHWASESCDQ